MRYVKVKTIITRTVDEIINDLDTIKAILKIVCDKEMTCSVRLSSGPMLAPARVLSCKDNAILLQVVKSQNTLRKEVLYNEIDYLEINSQDTVLAAKENISRWMLLDPSSDV